MPAAVVEIEHGDTADSNGAIERPVDRDVTDKLLDYHEPCTVKCQS
jgi:hypothetical protein